MAQAALKVIRPVVKAVSTLSPGISGRLAFRLFCTPVGHAKVNAANPAMRAAQQLFAGAEMRRVTTCNGYVRSFCFSPAGEARGTVALLHGWAGQALFMAGFVEPLLARGFRVVTFDLPAHGGSSGSRLNFPLAIEAFAAVLRAAGIGEGQPLAGMIGHSFGGALAKAAIAGGVPVFPAIRADRLASVSAPAGMQHYGRQFSHEIGLSARGHQAFEGEVMALTGRDMESFSGVAYLRQSGVPTLVIHSRDDRKIPFSDAETLAAAGPHVRLQPLSGLGHSRILFAKAAIGAAVAFIAGDD